jgi:hypothetical protein
MATEPNKFHAASFPGVVQQALEFHEKSTSVEEKKPVADAIRKAAKVIKKRGQGGENGEEGKEKKKKKGKLPSPEQIAIGLYRALSDNGEGKVSGDPRKGEVTQIRGQFDLTEVARKLLSFGG